MCICVCHRGLVPLSSTVCRVPGGDCACVRMWLAVSARVMGGVGGSVRVCGAVSVASNVRLDQGLPLLTLEDDTTQVLTEPQRPV